MTRKTKHKNEFVVQFTAKVKHCVLNNELVIIREENNDKTGVIRYIHCIFLFFIVCFYFFFMRFIIMQTFFFSISVIVVQDLIHLDLAMNTTVSALTGHGEWMCIYYIFYCLSTQIYTYIYNRDKHLTLHQPLLAFIGGIVCISSIYDIKKFRKNLTDLYNICDL